MFDRFEMPMCECEDVHGEIVNQVRHSMPSDEEVYELADFFKVFGDSTRLRILWALDRCELCVCNLAEALGMTKSAISHQLKVLRDSKIVRYRRDGKNIFYSLDDDHIRDILEKGIDHLNE